MITRALRVFYLLWGFISPYPAKEAGNTGIHKLFRLVSYLMTKTNCINNS